LLRVCHHDTSNALALLETRINRMCSAALFVSSPFARSAALLLPINRNARTHKLRLAPEALNQLSPVDITSAAHADSQRVLRSPPHTARPRTPRSRCVDIAAMWASWPGVARPQGTSPARPWTSRPCERAHHQGRGLPRSFKISGP
jgi:hypothetical protein